MKIVSSGPIQASFIDEKRQIPLRSKSEKKLSQLSDDPSVTIFLLSMYRRVHCSPSRPNTSQPVLSRNLFRIFCRNGFEHCKQWLGQ
jgi:hypothetical protein